MMNGSITAPDDGLDGWTRCDDEGLEREAIHEEASNDVDSVEQHDGATITTYADEDDETHSVIQIVPRAGHGFDHEVLALVRSQQPDEKGRETVADFTLISLRRPNEERDATLRYARQLVRHAQPWEPRPLAAAGPPVAASAPWADRVTPALSDWFTKKPEPRKWLLTDNRAGGAGVLPAGKVGMLIGEGGVSKTMSFVSLAIAVATGTPWLGAYDVELAGRVLLALGEEDAEEVQRRCYNAARAARVNAPPQGSIVALPLAGVPCSMVEADERGNAIDAPFLTWLRSYVAAAVAAAAPFSLILVDPLSRFAGADAEIDNAAATRFVQALEAIAATSGATVLVAHHTNKTSRGNGASVTGASARGSSAIYDGVRWAVSLSAERVNSTDDAGLPDALTEIVTLATVKSNYSRKGEPVLLRRDSDNGGALVPLCTAERGIVAEARQAADPGARRRAGRETDREVRAERDAAEREARAAAVVAAKAGRFVAEDTALVEVLEAQPGVGTRELRAAMAARLGGCSTDATDTALARLGSRLRRDPGPRGSLAHSLLIGPVQS